MNSRGFALLAVLWVLTSLTVLSGVALTVARTGAQATRNRVLLARAGWAREACAEILLARYAQNPGVRKLDTIDLGRGTWCRVGIEDAGAKLNLNVATRPELRALLLGVVRDSLAADSLVSAIVAWRQHQAFPDESALLAMHGIDTTLHKRLATLLTTRGHGAVDVSEAPLAVLRTLPGATSEMVEVLADRRVIGRPVANAEELVELLAGNSREALLGAYREFVAATSFVPLEFTAIVDGGVHGTPVRSRVTVTLVPTQGRLAVIRRETE